MTCSCDESIIPGRKSYHRNCCIYVKAVATFAPACRESLQHGNSFTRARKIVSVSEPVPVPVGDPLLRARLFVVARSKRRLRRTDTLSRRAVSGGVVKFLRCLLESGFERAVELINPDLRGRVAVDQVNAPVDEYRTLPMRAGK